MTANPPTPTQFQRYECKYVLDEAEARSVRNYLLPYLTPDPHAARQPGGEYRISSMYLDSPDLRLLRETVGGIRTRYKLRIRSYDEDPDGSLFLEVKHRRNQVVKKTRSRLLRPDLAGFLQDTRDGDGVRSDREQQYFEDFRARLTWVGAVPQVVVGYRREAFEGCFDRSARVTFDREIGARAAEEADHLTLPESNWNPVSPGKVVLELKFNGRCPNWMVKVVQAKMLKRRSFSKYAMALEATRGDTRVRTHTA